MRTIARPIDVACEFDRTGVVKPYKFRIQGKNGPKVVQIFKIIKTEEEKLAGNKMMKFLCEGEIDGKVWTFEIKYELLTFKWMLFRI